MESKDNKNHDFSAVSYKSAVAERFRLFSKKVCRNHSETLTVMMDYFEHNAISPHEDPGPNMTLLEKKIKLRINAVIAIIKDIEKNQTKPTVAMLQAILEQDEPKKKPLWVEKKNTSGNQPNYREFNR